MSLLQSLASCCLGYSQPYPHYVLLTLTNSLLRPCRPGPCRGRSLGLALPCCTPCVVQSSLLSALPASTTPQPPPRREAPLLAIPSCGLVGREGPGGLRGATPVVLTPRVLPLQMWHAAQVASALPPASLLPPGPDPVSFLPGAGDVRSRVTVAGEQLCRGAGWQREGAGGTLAWPWSQGFPRPVCTGCSRTKGPLKEDEELEPHFSAEGRPGGHKERSWWMCCWGWHGVGASRAAATELPCPAGQGGGGTAGTGRAASLPAWHGAAQEGARVGGELAWGGLLVGTGRELGCCGPSRTHILIIASPFSIKAGGRPRSWPGECSSPFQQLQGASLGVPRLWWSPHCSCSAPSHPWCDAGGG